MITKSETIRPNAVDLLKVIFCVFIICLHTEFLENTIGVSSNLTWIIKQYFFRLAVPFFFVTSGYFLGEKL